VPDNDIKPECMSIPFDIVNAKSMDKRSEAHYFHVGKDKEDKPRDIYSAKDGGGCNFQLESITKTDICSQKYWKIEMKSFVVECKYESNEQVAPFDELHLVLKMIVANCRHGTQMIRFECKEDECIFNGLERNVLGFYPKSKPQILRNNPDAIHEDDETKIDSWSRFTIFATYKSNPWESLLSHYLIPYTLFFFIVLSPYEDSESLISTSSTLVLANVALLIVSQNNVFTYCEQAVLLQIVILIFSTVLLVMLECTTTLRMILLIVDVTILCILILCHKLLAVRVNKRVLHNLKNKLEVSGMYGKGVDAEQ